MKRSILFLSLLLLIIATHAQRVDKKLQRQITALIQGFNGNIGVYVKDLRTNKVVAINADTVFPTASMIKIPILTGVMDKINRGELNYRQEIVYKDSLLYAGVDILGSFKDGEKIELSKLIMLMLTMSDNTASLWLQSLAGGGTRINAIMDSLGFQNTRVNSRTPGREAIRNVFGWGMTTPREISGLMEKIVNGEIINKESSARMLRLLGRNYWDENAIAAIPPDVFVASKYGAVNETRYEVLIVIGKKARYIFSVCTKNNKDQSWQPTNEAWVLTKKISELLWQHYGH
jgi:beta-lactamase class A